MGFSVVLLPFKRETVMICTAFVLVMYSMQAPPKTVEVFESEAKCRKVEKMYSNDTSLPGAYILCEPQTKANTPPVYMKK